MTLRRSVLLLAVALLPGCGAPGNVTGTAPPNAVSTSPAIDPTSPEARAAYLQGLLFRRYPGGEVTPHETVLSDSKCVPRYGDVFICTFEITSLTTQTVIIRPIYAVIYPKIDGPVQYVRVSDASLTSDEVLKYFLQRLTTLSPTPSADAGVDQTGGEAGPCSGVSIAEGKYDCGAAQRLADRTIEVGPNKPAQVGGFRCELRDDTVTCSAPGIRFSVDRNSTTP